MPVARGGDQKRGKRAGVRARLKTNPSRPALPSILLSNVCSLDNKLDYIRLQQTTRREFRDCCVFVCSAQQQSSGRHHSARRASLVSSRQKHSSVW
ncbi:hypothetical protein PGIGA_G00247310 [Pangasianodon gigas]|uniref:Uncharacterized protein n=1 Tax=Pangasianodon gigas TaxID=30993 RepID=A0ACC5WPW0_PANGG|nr:hypothetical protein [Pangasianodon gigas]